MIALNAPPRFGVEVDPCGQSRPSAHNSKTSSWRLSKSYGRILGLQVFIDPFMPSLPAETRLLNAAKESRGIGHQSLVDAHHPGIQGLHYAQRPTQVLRENVGH